MARFAWGLIGVEFLAGSAAQRVVTTTFSIPPGANYCTFYKFDVLTVGSITITYAASPGLVYQHVLTNAQHIAWLAGSGISDIGVDQGSANTFPTALPSGGTYYVLSCHGSGYESTTQIGQHTMTLTGIDPGPFSAGIGAILVTLLLVGVAFRLRSKDARAPRPPPFPAAVDAAYPGSTPYPSAFPYPAVPAGVPALRTLHLRLENASTVAESLQVLLNGAPFATVPVPAGQTAEMDLHPNAGAPLGGMFRVEVISGGGSRAAQVVVPDAAGRAEVTLRVG